MKQLLKKAFCALLLLSSIGSTQVRADHCGFGCDTGCNTSCGTYNSCDNGLGCNTGCGTGCFVDGNFEGTNLRSCFNNNNVRTHINYRSQGANTARELVGWQHAIDLPDICQFYGAMYLAFEYQRTFRPCRLAESIFGSQCLNFQGSAVPNRSANALVADYFGLPATFSDRLCFCPRIENFIVDLGLYFGLDEYWQGGFLRFHLPLVHSRWELFDRNDDDCCNNNYCCQTFTTTTAPVPTCLLGGETVSANNLQSALGTCNTVNGFNGVNNSNCCGAGISFCRLDDTRLADIDVILGWNFYNDPCYHLGLGIQYVAPTGNRPCGNYLFEPQIGNGKHHELGLFLTAHATLWDDQQYQNLSFWVQGNVTHMFGDCQRRTFDLCANGAYSRYLLLRQFQPSGALVAGQPLVQARCTPLANRYVDVEIDAKVDMSFKFAYQCCNWGLDIGYNVYYQSEESIDCGRHNDHHNGRNRRGCYDNNCNTDCRVSVAPNVLYGVAGLTGSCCYNYTVTNLLGGTCQVTAANGTLPVNAIRPTATAFDASAAVQIPTADITDIPVGTSAICLAYNSELPTPSPAPGIGTTCDDLTAANGYRPVITSDINAAQLLNPCNPGVLNLRSALAPEVLTHKIFVHLNYIWADDCGWNPFLGVGAEGEFTPNHRDCHTNNNRCDHHRLDLNQWGVWVKGGVSF